uniref:hypothetical protein n=1 Tax=Altererythrobacter segetis TaxID=1104773 RepID=UPI00140ADA7E|nr:hypothetical protein [Altererythrobacter segetis]
MTRHLLAFAAATVLGAAATPAAAQDRSPPRPAWDGPQGPHYPDPMPPPHHSDGAPFAHPLPPGVYPQPYPSQVEPYPGGPGPYEHRPLAGQGEGGLAYGGGSSYWYAYQSGGAPCGCPSYTWIPVPIETRYRYSAPLRHVDEVVEEKVVREQVSERKIVPAQAATKYVKLAKVPKGKTVRTTK